jgi:NhaP-type Na+/H+ or K+/H+ antiporter
VRSIGTDERIVTGYMRIELTNRWGLCILCVLLIGALITSYYLQIKKIRAIHETVISIFAGMVVGLIIRLSPGHVIREMLVSLFCVIGYVTFE